MAIASVICGIESWNSIESYGNSKKEWLHTFLHLPNGIPSHGAFNRVFFASSPEELEKTFLSWTRSVAKLIGNEIVCMDGKSLRGIHVHGSKSIVHMAGARACENRMALGRMKVDDKGNEITKKEVRLYISSLKSDAELINKSARSHWIIENSLYWVLDVSFNEDHCRKRNGYAAQDFSLTNGIALNLLKRKNQQKWV